MCVAGLGGGWGVSIVSAAALPVGGAPTVDPWKIVNLSLRWGWLGARWQHWGSTQDQGPPGEQLPSTQAQAAPSAGTGQCFPLSACHLGLGKTSASTRC